MLKLLDLWGFWKKTSYLCFKYNKNKTNSYFVAKILFIDFKTILGQNKIKKIVMNKKRTRNAIFSCFPWLCKSLE